jgi:putative transposase
VIVHPAIAQSKDRLWSVDLFRCESILLKSDWVMVVMDVYTRRIIGFGVAAAHLDGIRVCWIFNRAITRQTLPGQGLIWTVTDYFLSAKARAR